MDQTAFEDQEVLGAFGKCGQNTDLDCRMCLSAGRYNEEKNEIGAKPLRNITDFKRLGF